MVEKKGRKQKLLGAGSYAYTITPPRPVHPIPFQGNSSMIERITKQYLIEIKRGEYTRHIFDPKNVMSSPILHLRPVQKHPRQTDQGYKYTMVLPYREKSLLDFLDENQKSSPLMYWNLLTQFQMILEGIVRIHQKRWIHRDIKLENFLVDSFPNDQFRLYLVDWAMALPFKKVYQNNESHWHESTQYNHPPEYKMYAIFKNILPLHTSFSREYLSIDPNIVRFLLLIDPEYEKHLDQAYRKMTRMFRELVDREPLKLDLAPKVDVYSLGVILMIGYIVWMRDSLSPTSTLAKKNVSLIRHMLDPFPLSRFSAQQALDHLNKILTMAPPSMLTMTDDFKKVKI